MDMTANDWRALELAVDTLENPSFAARLANALGVPVERVLQVLPARVANAAQGAVTKAVRKSLDMAIYSMHTASPPRRVPDRRLKALTGVTGALGGFFGLPALVVELPLTTTIMMRSIAEIARRHGEDLGNVEARLACVEVFALGGRTTKDNSAESGYFAMRAMLARAVTEATKYIAERGVAEEAAPALVRLITSVAARFGIVVSEKVAATAVPVVGAVGGAGINVLFMDHFQNVAHGHFTVRRLERVYGAALVRSEYERARRN
jgi:EcsC protein family